MEGVDQYIPNPLWCYTCQKYGHHEDNCRGCEVCWKCGQQNPDHRINDCQFPCKCANCGGDHPVYARSCESWRQEKELLTVKHQNNIPYYEACKLVESSKTTRYSQAVQRNKSPYNKCEMIFKTLIQLEPGDWESFINKIKALLDTTKATDTSITSVDLAENKTTTPNTDLIRENRYWGENGNNTNHVADKTPCNKISN